MDLTSEFIYMAWKILTFSILATVTIKHVTVSKKYICKKTSVNIRIIKFWETCNVINYKWNDACSSYVGLKRVTSLLNDIHMHISSTYRKSFARVISWKCMPLLKGKYRSCFTDRLCRLTRKLVVWTLKSFIMLNIVLCTVGPDKRLITH